MHRSQTEVKIEGMGTMEVSTIGDNDNDKYITRQIKEKTGTK